MNEHDDEDDDFDGDEEFDVYDVDDDTRNLIEAACNCIASLAEAQIDPQSQQNLMMIADQLAERFAINAMELEQHHHISDDGEEVLLAPKGGVFPDADPEPEQEGEAPAVEP